MPLPLVKGAHQRGGGWQEGGGACCQAVSDRVLSGQTMHFLTKLYYINKGGPNNTHYLAIATLYNLIFVQNTVDVTQMRLLNN